MSHALKLALVAVVAIAAAAGTGMTWLKGRIQTTDYCANCHVVAPYYDSWKASALPAHTHAQVGLVCQDCHSRTVRDGLRELAVTVARSYEIPLKEHPVRPEAQCFRCHVGYEFLAGLTSDLKGPDGLPLGRNPHDSHWGPLECGICHKMHRASVDFCSNCHGLPFTGPAWTVPSNTAPHAPPLPHSTTARTNSLEAMRPNRSAT